jgi:hypothetical protein
MLTGRPGPGLGWKAGAGELGWKAGAGWEGRNQLRWPDQGGRAGG